MVYGGVTIGPIFETMEQTSTPAGLWFSSYFFSMITRDLCMKFQKGGDIVLTLPKNYVVSEHLTDNGIGKYHDRILITSDCADETTFANKISNYVNEVIELRAKEIYQVIDENLDEVKEYLHKYLCIHFIVLNEKQIKSDGIIKSLNNALDSLELNSSSLGKESKSYLKKIILGTAEDSNKYLRKYTPLLEAVNTNEFTIAKNINGKLQITDIASISGVDRPCKEKINNYFAIIQADGDYMGKLLSLSDKDIATQQNRISSFSEFCMNYTEQSSKMISDYGGVVIYSGGDDLLFIVPIVSNKTDDNVFSLCKKISENFIRLYKKSEIYSESIRASISFGISINYYKFPLYEAFKDARYLLFSVAKNYGSKNNIVISLHKASGQSSNFICKLDSYQENEITLYDLFLIFVKLFLRKEQTNNTINTVKSIIYTIDQMSSLFNATLGDEILLSNLMDNAFDNVNQKDSKDFRNSIKEFILKAVTAYNQNELSTIDNDTDAIKCIVSMLMITKMLNE